jgi:hypothetical protein
MTRVGCFQVGTGGEQRVVSCFADMEQAADQAGGVLSLC